MVTAGADPTAAATSAASTSMNVTKVLTSATSRLLIVSTIEAPTDANVFTIRNDSKTEVYVVFRAESYTGAGSWAGSTDTCKVTE